MYSITDLPFLFLQQPRLPIPRFPSNHRFGFDDLRGQPLAVMRLQR